MTTKWPYILFTAILCHQIPTVVSDFIDCAGQKTCKEVTKQCLPGEDCIIDCSGTRACDGAILNCPTGHTCNVTCSGQEACWGSVVNATFSEELYLKGCDPATFTYSCENIDVYCPSHQFGEANCHITASSKGLMHCTSCGYDLAGQNGLHFYALYGWLDMDISGNGGSGTMHCLSGFGTSCSIGTGWTCSGNSDCDITLSPTTDKPTSANPTTAIPTAVPTTAIPTTSIPTTAIPTTVEPTTSNPSTAIPTTINPTTSIPTTTNPTTSIPTTSNPSTAIPTAINPTTSNPTTFLPTTAIPTTSDPAVTTTKSGAKLTLFVTPESTKDTKVDDQMGEVDTTTTTADAVDVDYNKEGTEAFKISIWMIVSMGLFMIIICIACFICINRCKKNKKMRNEMNKNKLSNIQLTNAKHDGENDGQFGRIKSVSVDSPISKSVDNIDINIKNTNEDEHEFIVEDDNNNHSMMTPTFPENKYIQNANSDEFVVDEDDHIMTPQFPQNGGMINNGNDDEFIVENDDENDIITPTFGENNYMINNANDNEEIINGDDEDEDTEGDDNILQDLETIGAENVDEGNNNNNDNNNIMDVFTIN